MTPKIDRDKLIAGIENLRHHDKELIYYDQLIPFILSLPTNTQSREMEQKPVSADNQIKDKKLLLVSSMPEIQQAVKILTALMLEAGIENFIRLEYQINDKGYVLKYETVNYESSQQSSKDKQIEEWRSKFIGETAQANRMEIQLRKSKQEIEQLRKELSYEKELRVLCAGQCDNYRKIILQVCDERDALKSNQLPSSHTPPVADGKVCDACNGKRIWKENNSIIVCSECFNNDNEPTPKPITIEEAKDEVARKHGYKDWKDYWKYHTIDPMISVQKMINQAICLYNQKQSI